MADQKISQLTATAAAAADQIPINRSGSNYRINPQDIADLRSTAGLLATASNLSDVSSTATARTNLGAANANWNANKIYDINVSSTAPTAGQILKYNGTASKYEPAADSSGVASATAVPINGTIANLAYSGLVRNDAYVKENSRGLGNALYLDTDGKYQNADYSTASQMRCSALALTSATGSNLSVLLQGSFKSAFGMSTGVVYAATAGRISNSFATATGNIQQVLGDMWSSSVFYFDPSKDTLEVVNG